MTPVPPRQGARNHETAASFSEFLPTRKLEPYGA